MAANDLRQKALDAIDETRWIPPQGRNRIAAMIESRPDWCVSRQRAWGVPIPVFTEPQDRRAAARRRGRRAGRAGGRARGRRRLVHDRPAASFSAIEYDAAEWEKVTDIIEVWFDSGSTHAFVLEKRPELKWPASLYLEGSDQHRGWFHSSLLESCGTRGRAPYEAVLTHGFVLDEDGRKMSKSLGNVIAPQDVMKQSGADILRLWVVASDYAEDLRIGPEILKHMGDAYRRLRNTLRYLLGALAGFSPDESGARRGDAGAGALGAAPPGRTGPDRAAGDRRLRFPRACSPRCIISARWICRRSISTSARTGSIATRADDPARRATRTVMDRTFDCLARWLAPILCFTAEEAWLARHGDAPGRSIHLELFPEVPAAWHDPALGGALGRIARSAPGRDRRSRSRARRQAHRVEPAGRGRDLCAGAAAAAAARGRSRRAVHHLGRNGARRNRRRRGPLRCPMSPGSASS